ncbi:hypothetical protein THTE_1647 [Thermogutta terrifontis]|uniref:Uncharacterized protein n=1 Tax=Thermogutta terrifontis TaxID=1331910 RepID=A0A286RE55_9BACT|nr:hypothetical protein THTE_1647 [Thermogutta terrifontis]
MNAAATRTRLLRGKRKLKATRSIAPLPLRCQSAASFEIIGLGI